MEEEELYPPRFFIKVNGRQATDQATAVIRFTGAQGDLETELSLEPFTQQTGTARVKKILEKGRLYCNSDCSSIIS